MKLEVNMQEEINKLLVELDNAISSREVSQSNKKLICKKLDFFGVGAWSENIEYSDSLSGFNSYENAISRRSFLNPSYFLLPDQFKVLNELLLTEDKKIVLSAPTSFGKTFIISEYIKRMEYSNIVYIVPTNALSFELIEKFGSYFSSEYDIYDSKIMDFNFRINKNRTVFVGTQEKFWSLQKSFDEIDLLIIDESYKLGEGNSDGAQRDILLSRILHSSLEHIELKTILLLPKHDTDNYAFFNIKHITTEFSPVATKLTSIRYNSEVKKFKELMIKKEKTLIYCSSDNLIKCFNKELGNYSYNFQNVPSICKLINHIEELYHPEWYIIKLLKKGILVHNGQLPKYLQKWMLEVFNNDKDVYAIIATRSISEGINTETKNVILFKNCDLENTMLLKNTVGRAGRLCKYPIGHVFATNNILNKLNAPIDIKLKLADNNFMDIVKEKESEEVITKLSEKYEIDGTIFSKFINKSYFSIDVICSLIDEIIDIENSKSGYDILDSILDIINNNKKPNRITYKVCLFTNNNCIKSRILEYIKILEAEKKSKSIDNIIADINRFSFNIIPNSIFPVIELVNFLKNNNYEINSNYEYIFDAINTNYKILYTIQNERINMDFDEQIILSKLMDNGILAPPKILSQKMINTISYSLTKSYISFNDISNIIVEKAKTDDQFKKIVTMYYGFHDVD